MLSFHANLLFFAFSADHTSLDHPCPRSSRMHAGFLTDQRPFLFSLASRATLPALPSSLRISWEAQVQDDFSYAEGRGRNDCLIREMATNNWLWGAERIWGELLKLGIRVCKRTIQKYMRGVRPRQPRGQKWSTFLRNHAAQVWACDFMQVTDLFFQPLFAFFLIELQSRKVIHVGVTRSPTDTWVAQQLREATPYGQAPKYLIL